MHDVQRLYRHVDIQGTDDGTRTVRLLHRRIGRAVMAIIEENEGITRTGIGNAEVITFN